MLRQYHEAKAQARDALWTPEKDEPGASPGEAPTGTPARLWTPDR